MISCSNLCAYLSLTNHTRDFCITEAGSVETNAYDSILRFSIYVDDNWDREDCSSIAFAPIGTIKGNHSGACRDGTLSRFSCAASLPFGLPRIPRRLATLVRRRGKLGLESIHGFKPLRKIWIFVDNSKCHTYTCVSTIPRCDLALVASGHSRVV